MTSIVRTLIWTTHLQLFAENPLLGRGTFVFTDVAPEFLQYNSRGSESFATGLLARIGAMALLFFYAVYLFAVEAARQADRFSFCLVILFSVTLLAYGSYIVPYDFIFLVLFGARNFSRRRAAARQPQAALAAPTAAREVPPRARHAPGS